MRLPALSALLACLAAGPSAQEFSVRYVTGLHPLASHPLEDAEGRWLACRAVDAFTGLPIPGAELCLVAESQTPIGGEFRFVRKASADSAGFVTLRLSEARENWLVLRAPGYGPSSDLDGVPGLVWPLAPALDVPVRILDWLDRPVPRAGVGFCLGCGHTPDVVHALADENGIAVLRGIDPWNDIADVYPRHPGLGIDDYGRIDWAPGDPPALVRASWGTPVRGTLLDPSGRPVGGAFVGTKNKHRGPWTRTLSDGSFRLDGTAARDDLFVVLAAQPEHEYLFERSWRQPVTLRLPVADERPCQVVAGDATTRTLPPTPLATVRVEAPPGCRVTLVRREGATDVTDFVQGGEPVSIPAEETFAFALLDDSDARILPFTAAEALREESVRLRFLPPTRVRARLVDPEGNPVAAAVELLPRRRFLDEEPFDARTLPGVAADGEVELASTGVGQHVLAVRPERADLAPLFLALALPSRGPDARLDLGRVPLTAAPRLCLVSADGQPYAGPRPGLLRLGWTNVRDRPPSFPLDARGAWLGLEPLAGDAILVPACDWDLAPAPEADGSVVVDVPFRSLLQGKGPWTLTLPAGELWLEVTEPDGAPLAATVFVADRSIAIPGRALLCQLSPGPLELVVTARERQTALATVVVPATGRAEIRLALPKR